MRPTIAAIGLLLVSVLTAFAEEPSAPPVDQSALNRHLVERIAQLEKRVAELEARLARSDVPVAPSDAPNVPQYGPTFPTPRGGDAMPRTPSDRVPDNWQRIEFNGYYYYVIPVGGWEPGTTQHRSPLLFPARTFPANGDRPIRGSENSR